MSDATVLERFIQSRPLGVPGPRANGGKPGCPSPPLACSKTENKDVKSPGSGEPSYGNTFLAGVIY